MSFRPDEILTTDRLTLRSPTLEDAGAIFDGYAQDPEVTRYTNWKPHTSIETTEQFLREAIEAWNGDATETTRAIVDHAFSAPQIRRVSAYCHVDNGGSVRVLEKCGMQREGRLHRCFVFPNLSDEPGDVFLFAITR